MSSSKKRQSVTVACNRCRARKIACDGRRPVCASCMPSKNACIYDTRNTKETRYAALKRENEELKRWRNEVQDLLTRLRLLPNDGPVELLQHLRQITEPQKVLLDAYGASRSLQTPQISEHDAARATLPRTKSKLEYELMVSHPSIYCTWGGASSPDIPVQAALGTKVPRWSIPGPIKPPAYADSRLSRLQISYWTKVPISNELAAIALSLYLETDHPVLGLFDADLFLADLVGHRFNFCSSLLVTSVLFWACQMYSAIDSQASIFSTKFLREAQRLWQAIDRSDSFLTAAALQLLSLGCTGIGDEALGTQFENEGRAMAERLGLIGTQSKSLFTQYEDSAELSRAMSHTAWGIFNYLMLRSIHYREYVIRCPPSLPIPGEQLETHRPSSLHPLPHYMGNTFTRLCNFWLIVQEFALYYYGDSSSKIPLQDRVPLAVAERIYQKLLSWADSVSTSFSDSKSDSHHLAILQIWYHSVVVDVFRPFRGQGLTLQTFTYANSTPEQIIEASLNQLKRHVLTFPSRYPAATYAIFWHPACMYVANAVLADVVDSEGRRYFDLCTHAYQSLSSSYRFAITVLQSLLDMATRQGVISISESRSILDKACNTDKHSMSPGRSISTYKVDLDLAMTSPRAADIASLGNSFKDKLIMEHFEDSVEGDNNELILRDNDDLMFDELTTLTSDR